MYSQQSGLWCRSTAAVPEVVRLRNQRYDAGPRINQWEVEDPSSGDGIDEDEEDHLMGCHALVKTLQEDTDIRKYYKTKGALGKGCYCETFEVVPVHDPRRRLAMKIQPKKDAISSLPGREHVQMFRLYREILVLNRILPRHKNIAKIEDVLVSKNNVYIVQELCDKSSLEDFYPVADNVSGARVFKQLAEAIHFCHQHGVFHNNLCADNVLFAGPDFKECKIINFGLSEYKSKEATKTYKRFNPGDWFSEEQLNERQHVSLLNDEKDLGKILLSMMSGTATTIEYSGWPSEKRLGTFVPRMDRFDERALDLLSRIGPPPFGPEDEKDVLPVDQIINHPWLTAANEGPVVKNLDREFSMLRDDLTVLAKLFSDSSMTPLKVLTQDEELNEHYQILGNLQRGAFVTTLFECTDTATRTWRHAMKMYERKGDPSISPDVAARRPLRIYNELMIILRILPRHPFIVDVYDVLVHKNFAVVVRELCERHTLEDFLPFYRNERGRLIFKQIAETVRFLHRFGVVHMNLHCQHIVFVNHISSQWKLVDFSNALYVPTLAQYSRQDFDTRRWITPELSIMADDANPEVDVRAVGQILLALLGLRPQGADPVSQGRQCDAAALDLLSKIGPPPFGSHVGQRTLTMEEVCSHPWLAEI
ncbi:hypothetical protein MPTK1_3g12730 [Marchantia polymorpha subsp. ruderalis]|uniref:Protein kinase domain-containing protein n=2 Tax=Marchantia polymorpha TaxID=3197 RepID=A0AAF6B061_MARPO|nr:hypothetical protein MARPO_0050s0065 [Marchantia polymorpha]BBN05395.1 hypothetical protein Mp_3g12730 [Marchantia polymorpha subsp. ruderalis]|eukprot:PTQ38608.1 hypothetical protein MARPO_0050s0065 [Marchantia polymorpha]